MVLADAKPLNREKRLGLASVSHDMISKFSAAGKLGYMENDREEMRHFSRYSVLLLFFFPSSIC